MLTTKTLIAESDSDMEFVASIVVGFDYLNNFVVQYLFEDYRENGRDWERSAIVDEDDAKRMAQRLRVPLAALPKIIYDRFNDFSGISVPSEVEGTFKEILDFILDCGARFRFKKKAMRS